MLIRTQDKRSLVDMIGMTVCISFDGSGSKSEIRAIPNHTNSASYNLLGTYSTEAKALKVLDMIQEVYENANYTNNYIHMHSGYVKNTVFEMPADEDVEV